MLARIYRSVTHGPCDVCGRRWLLGWSLLNINGVCSWRCYDAQAERWVDENLR